MDTPRTRDSHQGLTAVLSTRSAGIVGLLLDGQQFQATDDHGHMGPMDIVTTHYEETSPLRAQVTVQRHGATVTPVHLDFTGQQSRPGEATFTWHGEDLDIVRVVRGEQAFSLRVETHVTNRGAPATVDFSLPLYHYLARDDESGGFFRQSWQVAEGLCLHGDDLLRESRDKLADRSSTEQLPGAAHFAGIGNLYFVSAIVPRGDVVAHCQVHAEDRALVDGGDPVGARYTATLVWPRVDVGTGETRDFTASAYFGPKEPRILAATAPALARSVNLGFFGIIARVLVTFLQWLYSIVHNWGLAIILLTVCVRIALFPLLAHSMKSLAMMQQLKPELDALNERYKDNPEQKGMATMELYRKKGISPLSGCLPQVAQLPVWWAFYTTLQTSVELFHAPFVLYWHDLSARDQYFVLPLILGAVMFIQQRMMPPQGMDPVQAKMMMYIMPIFLTGISLALPSGLALYMLTNSLLGIAQQRYAKSQIERMKRDLGGDGSGGTGGGQGIVVRPAGGTA